MFSNGAGFCLNSATRDTRRSAAPGGPIVRTRTPLVVLAALLLTGLIAIGAAATHTPASVAATPDASMSAPAAAFAQTAALATETQTRATAACPNPQGRLVIIDIDIGTATPITSLPTPLAGIGPSLQIVDISSTSNDETIHVLLNQPIFVELATDLTWTFSYQPADIVCEVPGSGPTSLPAGVQAFLYAAAPGTVTIAADGHPICTPGQACPQFVRRFSVTVVVSAASSTAPSPPGASASPPSGPIRLPDTGRHDLAAPVALLLGASLTLAVAGLAAFRRARGDT
jgi:hypothetical protein